MQELSPGTLIANLVTGLGVDEIFIRTDGVGARNFLADPLGSTLALTDSTGTLQTQYTYEPFGNTSVSGSTNASSYQYTGRENDGTGLYLYRARYYSPATQRFISGDPIAFEGGINLYAYLGNNPISFADPLGLKPRRRPTRPPGACPPEVPPETGDPPGQTPPAPQRPDKPRPPKDKDYDDCVQQAAARRDRAIRNGRLLQILGGGLIELGAGTGFVTIPVLNDVFFELAIHGTGLFAYAGAVGPALAGLGPFGLGSAQIADAWDQYYNDLISCAAAR